MTAVLENDPVVGMEEKKEPKMLQMPRATISWLASTVLPPAKMENQIILICFTFKLHSQNALAMAMDSRIAMMGMMMMAELSSDNIPENDISWSGPCSVALAGMENGGAEKGGTPASIFPVNMKVQL